LSFNDSELTVVFTETYDEDNKIKHPSLVQFWLETYSENPLDAFEIHNLELIDPNSEYVQKIEGIVGRAPRLLKGENRKMNSVISFSPSLNIPPPAELILRATVMISREQGIIIHETIKLSFTLKTGKERHWDWFERLMSV